jgi:hypothetical protein
MGSAPWNLKLSFSASPDKGLLIEYEDEAPEDNWHLPEWPLHPCRRMEYWVA